MDNLKSRGGKKMIRMMGTTTALLITCAGGFIMGSTLSPDAVAMALGILFGVLAMSLPVALIVAHHQRQPPTAAFDERETETLRQLAFERLMARLDVPEPATWRVMGKDELFELPIDKPETYK